MSRIEYLIHKWRSKRWQRANPRAIPVVDSLDRSGKLLLVSGWADSRHNVSVNLKYRSADFTGVGPTLRSARSDLDIATLGSLPGFHALFELSDPQFESVNLGSVSVEVNLNGDLARVQQIAPGTNAYPPIRNHLESLWTLKHLSLTEAVTKLQRPLMDFNDGLAQHNKDHHVVYSNCTQILTLQLLVVIPLYGNSGLLEHQMLTFQRFRTEYPNVKFAVVFVVDDPQIAVHVEHTVRLLNTHVFELPVTVVAKNRNTGFASACNLGSKQHESKFIMFWNSDLIPDTPTALYNMVQTLESCPSVGAVSPVICDLDYTVQTTWLVRRPHSTFADFRILESVHQGMQFKDLDDSTLRVDSGEELLLSGAALMVRSEAFANAGRFSHRYGFGDFEDGELSYRLREISDLKIVRVPFLHIQGHSFKRHQLIETFCRSRMLDAFLNHRHSSCVQS